MPVKATDLLVQKLTNDHVRDVLRKRARKQSNIDYVANGCKNAELVITGWSIGGYIVIALIIELSFGLIFGEAGHTEWIFAYAIAGLFWGMITAGIIEGMRNTKIAKMYDKLYKQMWDESNSSNEEFDLEL